ncbi:MAG: magnesium protoporphyrin IX methyltransferase [Phycisphaerae bacterium]|nr:magnesium protoporphyrin IX methyltransferase [Gemmatimonadaceae bacterium]
MDRVLPNTPASDTADYVARRAWIAEYFDRTASAAWAQLTSDAPVSAVRRSVRAARDRMRTTLASWLPQDLTGRRILDAGCGTGALAIDLAARGAHVLAIDLAPTLVQLAAERTPAALRERIDFRAGDMFDASLGTFDHVVAMDSIIHYRAPEMMSVVNGFRSRATRSVLFTVVPRTPLLMVLHTLGRAFPRGERAPAIEPMSNKVLMEGLKSFEPHGWYMHQSLRVSGGFYTSQAIELRHEETAQ